MQLPQLSTYTNAMEPLVTEAVEQLLQTLPLSVVESINQAEAIAYALNRLPPLYATTEEGWYWQQAQAKETLLPQIFKAAHWGIKAAQKKHTRFPNPLSLSTHSEYFAAFQRVRNMAQKTYN
ncbi:late competence development ComFB family protein [Oscillatoria salina]|uniref:late competence development ComFB family protein n=1 Tax=Oscillatoria salina TaxID=331517 RepID=UPI001CCCE48A|nr:late competence development ComFB family protein [Oscillatoria salina]